MKPNKHEDEYIWVQELQGRMAKLAKEQQAESEAEKLRLKEASLDALPEVRPRVGNGDVRRGRNRRLPELQGCVARRGRIGNDR